MGILNVTPDSCYDQGRWFDPKLAIQRGIEIYQQGADLIDIGGESTRPGAKPVHEEEELKRVIPIIKQLRKEIPIPISIDTMKAKVAEKAIEAGASLINDVTGFSCEKMQQLAADTNVPICIMHMDKNPETMQINPFYEMGIIPFLLQWFDQRINLLLNKGIKNNNIIIDPGIGFGKSVDDNIAIVHNLDKFKALGFPVLIGLSRKSFLGKIINKPFYSELLPATMAVNTLAIQAGVDMIRVHDIVEHHDVLTLLKRLEKRI